ncbi:hypothetical protein GCM10007989_24360 [Devosia pacifica]|uniref:Glycine-rich domain-containing protein n=1 Tax=Devosia pacifica TaxID=1335967 RepID=A0A918VVS8_9HYPH|nr:hypothetical protein [Devosia pacifica]GHA27622.1 hypothetical protein GCM10007989_24360 [Devosia pacifica]
MANLSELMGGGSVSGILDEQVFDASGTWTKHEDAAAGDIVEIEMHGAAGGGYSYSGSGRYVWSGQPGSYVRFRVFARHLAASQPVIVGSGGAPNGGSGGGTEFAGVFLQGGSGGYYDVDYPTSTFNNAFVPRISSAIDWRAMDVYDAQIGNNSTETGYRPALFFMCGGSAGYFRDSSIGYRKDTLFGGKAGDIRDRSGNVQGTRGTFDGENPGGSGGATASGTAGKGGNGRVIIRVLKGAA